MPAGKSPRCRACGSPRRAEIDRRLVGGVATRKVAAWLREEHGEEISDVALAAHKRNHVAVEREAREQIQREQLGAEVNAVFDGAVKKIIADVHLMDEIASLAMDAARRIGIHMDAPTMAQAAAFSACLKEAREAEKQKAERLGGRVDTGSQRPSLTIVYPPGISPLADQSQPTASSGAPEATASPAGDDPVGPGDW